MSYVINNSIDSLWSYWDPGKVFKLIGDFESFKL